MPPSTPPSESPSGTTARRVSVNAASNALVVGVDMLVSMLLMAYVLRVLSREMYGIWAVTGALFAYSTVVQLGLNSAINYFVPPLLLQKDFAGLNRVVSTALVFYVGGGLLLLIGTVVVTIFFPVWFQIPDGAVTDARTVVVLVGGYFVVSVPLSVYQGVLSGLQRYVAMNVTRLTCRLARAGLIVGLLWGGTGLVGLGVGHVVGRLAEVGVMPLLAHRYLPELRVRWSLASWASFRSMFAYSAYTLLWSFAALVRDRAAFIIIGVFLSASAAAAYQIPVTLMQALDAGTQSLAAVTKPAASALIAEGRTSAVQALVLRGVRLVLAGLLPVVALLCLYADVIIPLWVGDQYADAIGLVRWLLVAQLPLTGQAVASYVLIGINRHRALSCATLSSAGLGVVLMMLLSSWAGLGLNGIAIGAGVPMIVMGGIVIPLLTCRAVGIGIWPYVRGAVGTPLLAAIPFLALSVGMRFWWAPVSLVGLAVTIVLSLPLLIVCDYYVVATVDERRWLTARLRGRRAGG